MYFIYIFLFSLLNVHSCFDTNETENAVADVSYIADILLNLFEYDGKNDTPRIQELKEKLAKIDSYVVDREKYTARLANESRLYFLNATNFYLALNENDQYKFRNDSRNLYVKLKEKMNRDDLLQILAERGGVKIKKSARRMMEHRPNRRREQDVNDAVDKYLGEFAHDNHNFGAEEKYSKYWDPEPELKERRAFHQPSGGRRIYKGERTHVLYYPFMTSIHIMGRFWCGGVLYWNDLVITSAACLQLLHNNRFYRENPKVLGVRIGSNHSRFGGEVVEALEVFFHPSYNPKTLDNNIAVIRLQRHIQITYHRVPKLIALSNNDLGVPFTAEILLLGWGVQKISQNLVYEPMFLARKVLPVYPNKFCKEVYGEKFNPRTMFCVGTMTTGEGACAHDAGGPAILSGKVVGIISYGPSICGYPDAPTVLTLVGAYIDWIEHINETARTYQQDKARTTSTSLSPYVAHFLPKSSRGPKYTIPPEILAKLTKKPTTVESVTVELQTDKPVHRQLNNAENNLNPSNSKSLEDSLEIEAMLRDHNKNKKLRQLKNIQNMKEIDAQIQDQMIAIEKKANNEKRLVNYISVPEDDLIKLVSGSRSKERERIESSGEHSKPYKNMVQKAPHKQVKSEIDTLNSNKYYRGTKRKNGKSENVTYHKSVNLFDVSSNSDNEKKKSPSVSFERTFSDETNVFSNSTQGKESLHKIFNQPLKRVNEDNTTNSHEEKEFMKIDKRRSRHSRRKHLGRL